MPLSFSRQFERDVNALIKPVNKKITDAALGAWDVAVKATPVDTGRLRGNWKLNKGKKSGLIGAVGKYRYPKTPKFSFDIRKDRAIGLFNNVPYAVYVEEGLGKGTRVPRKMLFKAMTYFDAQMRRL